MPELSFNGKEFVYSYHLAVPFRLIAPDMTHSRSARPSFADKVGGVFEIVVVAMS